MTQTLDLSQSPLGKTHSYQSTYSPELLFPIPRKQARESLGLTDSLPFHGGDIWTGYELSWLNPKGKPQVAIIEFFLPCDTLNIIESKSLKLYLNSLNQTVFKSLEEIRDVIGNDLSRAANGPVTVNIIPSMYFEYQKIGHFSGICIDHLDVTIEGYEIDSRYLRCESSTQVQESLYSYLLKSNCLVTGQPDWATVFIRYAGAKIDHAGLLKYLISYRNHQGFHEQCVEHIYCDILEKCKPERLSVYGRYTRRGGLDINPFRSNFEKIPENIRTAQQ